MVDLRTSLVPGKEIVPTRDASPVKDDQRIAIFGVTYDQYEAVRLALDHVRGLKMTYQEGMLEIMSPGLRHELVKTMIARLLEVYALERGIDLTGAGETTFRKRAKDRGLEPDECYSVGDMKEVPDFALEVVVTSGGMDKLDVYAGLDVPEVWFWEAAKFTIHRLGPKGYTTVARSAFLPALDLDVLASFVVPEKNQTQVVRAFRDLICGEPA